MKHEKQLGKECHCKREHFCWTQNQNCSSSVNDMHSWPHNEALGQADVLAFNLYDVYLPCNFPPYSPSSQWQLPEPTLISHPITPTQERNINSHLSTCSSKRGQLTSNATSRSFHHCDYNKALGVLTLKYFLKILVVIKLKTHSVGLTDLHFLSINTYRICKLSNTYLKSIQDVKLAQLAKAWC